MNIANAIWTSVADKMQKTSDGAFKPSAYRRIIEELKGMRDSPYCIINVEDVQANDTHCYALFGDGSVLVIQAKGKISALSVSGV